MRENDLIRELRAKLRDPEGVLGIGDDCCVWTPGGTTCLSVDAIVEGRHFTSVATPAQIGRKAAGAALSDLAAMGARPVGAAVTLVCPGRWDAAAIMDGLIAELARHHCPLLGGDTCGGDALVVSVTVWGEAAKHRLLKRSGATPGDLLVVTGPLGGSLASGRHLAPQPLLAEGAWFAGHPAVHALMDLSDGLATDAPKLAEASGCGCLLLPAQVPVHPDVPEMSDTVRAALCDGEDYELLAAVAPDQWPHLQLAWPFANRLCVVGWLIEQREILMEDRAGRVVPFTYKGFEHST
ncbi:MAG: thiamine-phosphate kinase [Planctomycetes bacterium]|nr:thiamine-phosphate kinase [Planctomycetota bacterium]